MITIIPTIQITETDLDVGEEYCEVTAVDTRNRYIPMKDWGIYHKYTWIETDPLTFKGYIRADMVNQWIPTWKTALNFTDIRVGDAFVNKHNSVLFYSIEPPLCNMFIELVHSASERVERTIKYKPLALNNGILEPCGRIPHSVLRIFDYIKELPVGSLACEDDVYRPYLDPYESCDIDIQTLVDPDGYVTFVAGFESGGMRAIHIDRRCEAPLHA